MPIPKGIKKLKSGLCNPPPKFNEKIIAVKQGNIIATSFHPELTKDVSIHRHFVEMVQAAKN